MDIKPSLFRVNFTPKELTELQKEVAVISAILEEADYDGEHPKFTELLDCIAKQAPI